MKAGECDASFLNSLIGKGYAHSAVMVSHKIAQISSSKDSILRQSPPPTIYQHFSFLPLNKSPTRLPQMHQLQTFLWSRRLSRGKRGLKPLLLVLPQTAILGFERGAGPDGCRQREAAACIFVGCSSGVRDKSLYSQPSLKWPRATP